MDRVARVSHVARVFRVRMRMVFAVDWRKASGIQSEHQGRSYLYSQNFNLK